MCSLSLLFEINLSWWLSVKEKGQLFLSDLLVYDDRNVCIDLVRMSDNAQERGERRI